MRGVMPSAAHFASLTLPETGKATGRCSQCESTTAEEATEYFGGGGPRRGRGQRLALGALLLR